MTAARRGGAPVGHLTELDPVEAGAVMYLRLWNDGPAAQARVEHDFRRCLGASDGHRALMALADLCSLCARHCRRPILRHDVRCRCLGSDEACFANFVAAAATGDHKDAMLIATLLVRADMAPSLTGLAATLGHALMRIAVSDVPAGATVH
ncbi:hypothetical protein [Albibacillus kandeliae]|uniref:hypothetical protein n=1 Tax=Albibacillus kandeliae TaxID=2174228 RepID=UPI000D69F83D|nr:hypothetical protein [Albibacillus kandeliae]